MVERFTDRARKVMALANYQAQHFNHNYLGSEHILLGLLEEGEGAGATVLKKLGLDLRRLREEIERQVLDSTRPMRVGSLPVAAPAKEVIEQSIAEARGLGHNYVGTEHLLLGLIADTSGLASRALVSFGLDLKMAREAVCVFLRTDPSRDA